MGKLVTGQFMTMRGGFIGNSHSAKQCSSCNKAEEHLYPSGIQEQKRQPISIDKLQVLQDQAEEMDMLLPTEMNETFTRKTIEDDGDSLTEKLLPIIY